MHTTTLAEPRAIETYTAACRTSPMLEREGRAGAGMSLYRWDLSPVRQVRIPETGEVTMAVHLGGVRKVRLLTEHGPSRQFSQPGDITLIPRGQPIHYLIEGGVDFATLHLSPSAAQIFGPDDGRALFDLPHTLFALRDPYAFASVGALLQTAPSTSPTTRRYAAKVFEALAWHLLHLASVAPVDPVRGLTPAAPRSDLPAAPEFARVLECIEQRIDGRLGLDELARLAGMGRTRFCESFARRFGYPPHRYVMMRRIERAKTLLRSGEANVTDVAYQLGFSSAAHFSTTFKSLTGISPQQFVAGKLAN